jgi:hypothetical protein
MIARPVLLLLPFLAAATAEAQTREDEQLWANLTVMKTHANGIAWFAEVQPRIGDSLTEVQQLIVRPAIGYKFSDALTVYAGYAHVFLPRAGADRNEDRGFAQASWTIGKLGRGTVSSRTRVEARDLSIGLGPNGPWGWRGREMLRFVHPITSPGKVRALVSAEVFVAFNDTEWGARSGFDQLRSFAGVEVPIGGKNTLELGYLNQWVDDPGPASRVNHVASVSAFFRL